VSDEPAGIPSPTTSPDASPPPRAPLPPPAAAPAAPPLLPPPVTTTPPKTVVPPATGMGRLARADRRAPPTAAPPPAIPEAADPAVRDGADESLAPSPRLEPTAGRAAEAAAAPSAPAAGLADATAAPLPDGAKGDWEALDPLTAGPTGCPAAASAAPRLPGDGRATPALGAAPPLRLSRVPAGPGCGSSCRPSSDPCRSPTAPPFPLDSSGAPAAAAPGSSPIPSDCPKLDDGCGCGGM